MQKYTEKKVTIADIDGRLMHYDACSFSPDAYDKAVFKYIGYGKIHSVDGVRQAGLYDYYFYAKVKP